MKVFPGVYKSRIDIIISSLGISGDGLVFGPDTEKSDAETVIKVLSRNTLVFIPYEMKGIAEWLGLIAVPYGMRLNEPEEGIFTDNLQSSVHFRYSDRPTAELAYALCLCFRKDPHALESIAFDRDETIGVKTEEEAISAMRRLSAPEKTLLVYMAPRFSDVRGLAAAMSGFDAVQLPKEAEGMKKMDRALDRVIFSPLVRRLSAVFHSSERAFCAKMTEEYTRVVRIALGGDEF